MERNKYTLYNKFFKRLLDLILSSLLLVIIWPIMLIVAILVRINLGTPVLFSVHRPGKNEKLFTMYKFRTMTKDKDSKGELLMDNLRLTSFGKFLRSTSLDELPELFNILKGDMSFVGPRPLALQYLPFYTKDENRRHSIEPGLTGLAQINGRNGLSWEDKFAYDIHYVDNLSFKMDLKIIIITIARVFMKENIGIRGVDAPEDFDKYRLKQLKKQEAANYEY